MNTWMCQIILCFEHYRINTTIQKFSIWRSESPETESKVLCVCYVHFSTMQKNIWSPPKRWNRSTRVPISFGLLIWFEPPNTLTKPCCCLLLSRRRMLSLLWKRDYQYIWNYIFSSCPLTSYNRLILGTDSVGFHSANKILIQKKDLNQGNTFLSEQRQLDNPSTQRHSIQTAQSWIRLKVHWPPRHSATNCPRMSSSTLTACEPGTNLILIWLRAILENKML